MSNERPGGSRAGVVLAIVFLAVTGLIVAGLIAAQYAGGSGGGLRGGSGGQLAQENYTYDAGDVRELVVELADLSVQVMRAEDGVLRATLPQDAEIRVREGSTLSFRQEEDWFSFRWWDERQAVKLYVPDGIETVRIASASGSVTVEGLQCGDLDASAASGRIEVSEVTASGGIEVSAISGAVNAQRLSAQEIAVSSTSGRVRAQELSGQDIHVKTVSGGIDATVESRCALSVESTSGRIELDLAKTVTGNVGSTSGSVDLRVDGEQTVRCSSMSGSIRLDGERVETRSGEAVLQRGEDSLSVKTVSGSISIAD